MSQTGLSALRELLSHRYDDLKRRLTWKLGSVELASDALHDTWLHLENRKEDGAPVVNPLAYLVRIAMNLALDDIQRERRFMCSDEIDALMDDIVDPEPGPMQVVGARGEIALLSSLIENMPHRRRAIFLAIRVEGLSHQEVAERFGVSHRLIGLELKRAHEYCMAHMPMLQDEV